jgi:hypothetical protein
MLWLAILLALVACVLLWFAARQRKAAGLPGGRIIYTDTSDWGAVEKPLYSAEIGLTGMVLPLSLWRLKPLILVKLLTIPIFTSWQLIASW